MQANTAKRCVKLITLIVFIAICMNQYAVEVIKSYELNFDCEIAFFLINDVCAAWEAQKETLYIFKGKKSVKTLKLRKGQGPGDFKVVSNIISTDRHFVLWDRMNRRFSNYSMDWEFESIKKFPNLFLFFPVGFNEKNIIARWNTLVRVKKGSEIIEKIGIINERGEDEIIYKAKGFFNDQGRINYDRPHLSASVSGDRLYYAINQDYKVYMVSLNEEKFPVQTVIDRKYKPREWDKKCEDLQWEIFKKPQQPPKKIYPANIPPLFTIFARGELIGVVTNEGIVDKKTKIDFFRNHKYIGSCEIPLLFTQHFVFPSFLMFRPGIDFQGGFLYTLHYSDDEEGTYKIISWEINF